MKGLSANSGNSHFFDNGFVSKLSPGGTALLYSTFLGGGNGGSCTAIAVDGGGNAYVTGTTAATNFPVTPGAFQTVTGGGGDLFVTKLNPTGTALVYSTYLGGNQTENPGDQIAVDSAGDAYVTGNTTSANFPVTPGAYQTNLVGSSAAFVTKLNPAGSGLVFSTYLGASGSFSVGNGIAVDPAGNVYVTGFAGPPFPLTAGALQTTSPVFGETFITELNPAGSALLYSTFFGGSGASLGGNFGYPDEAYGIALDSQENIYVTGVTRSTNFPITAGAFQTVLGGTQTAFGNVGNGFAVKIAIASPTPSPTSTSVFPCQSTFFVSRNQYSPQTDVPALFINTSLCQAGTYSLKIYNTAGEFVRMLREKGNQPAGPDQVSWDGKNTQGDYVASGVYIIVFIEPLGFHQARVAVVR
jgi:hypothetical protein